MDNITNCLSIHDTDAKCEFYLNNSALCKNEDAKLDYMSFIFCTIPSTHTWAGIVLCALWLLVLFIALGVTADDFLCPSLVVITKTLGISQNIAGVTFLAFGNGAPDIFSSLAGMQQERPELVIGTLFGAGIFVTSVVAGSIIAIKPFKIMERPFLRDLIFYILAAFCAFLRFYFEEVTLWHSISFIAMYGVYITVVVASRLIYNKWYKHKKDEAPKVPDIEILPPVEHDREKSAPVTFAPTGEEEDNPEAAGVVLRRFSFRGSLSVAKKRHSSVHSHHEHAIKAFTQSIETHTNPTFVNGYPPPLDSQISKNSLSSLLSSNGDPTLLQEFIIHIFPIDVEEWQEKSLPFKIFDIIKAPICFLLILTVPVVDFENEKNHWCRPLNILHIFTSPLFFILAIGLHGVSFGVVPLWGIILLVSAVVAVAIFLTSSNDTPPVYHAMYGYMGFATSVVWVYFFATEIVSLLQAIGIILKVSDAILGLTVLAWGNSIGDFISNLSVARQGYPRMGISACYGGPLLNLLLGIGVPFTVNIVKSGQPLKLSYEKLVILLYSALTTILICTLITIPLLRFEAKRCFGFILIALYFTFLATAIMMETNVI